MKLPVQMLLALSGLMLMPCIRSTAQTIRIMPMGNSITYDHNSLDDSNPRPVGDRISYRYALYQLLNEAGLDFDFVGNEDAGNNYFQDEEYDDNAGFPGIESWELANLVATGYNGYTHQYVSPGPYLNFYPADIILLHIGTNNLTTSPAQVEDVLDQIRYYDSDVIILVARILNRQTYHSATTTFNNNVELMVNTRGDSRIRMVNIEYGAAINYSADMIDNLHPNPVGFQKMAQKWFDEMVALNQPPVISSIPTQVTDKGVAFPNLYLNQYVSDPEDPDFKLNWTWEQQEQSHLSLFLDANNLLRVTPDPDWSGAETVTLKVRDTGSGAFPMEDSVDVSFQVNHVNTPPVITSTPVTTARQGSSYSYLLTASDVDGDPLSYMGVTIPSWLTFNTGNHTLSGVPGSGDVGSHSVALRVSDGLDQTDQSFQIIVENTNDPPVITSTPLKEIGVGQSYLYRLTAEDSDEGDHLTFTALNIPDWLHFITSSVDALVYGTPGQEDLGTDLVILQVSDGIDEVLQAYSLSVTNGTTAVDDPEQEMILSVYPNPADRTVRFSLREGGRTTVQIYDPAGVLQLTRQTENGQDFEVDISRLPAGLYYFRVYQEGHAGSGKFVKR